MGREERLSTNYRGVIIEESLQDGSILNKLKPSPTSTKRLSRNYGSKMNRKFPGSSTEEKGLHPLGGFRPVARPLRQGCENNYRLAPIINPDPLSRSAYCFRCTSYLGQPTIQGSRHLCFFGVPSVHGGNRDDMVRLSHSMVLCQREQILRGRLLGSAPRTL